MSTVHVPYKPDFCSLQKDHADFHMENFEKNRRSLLSELRCLSGFTEIASSLNQDTLYKVVLPEGKILQIGKDGLGRGVFYDKNGIAQHAKFTEVRQGLISAAETVGSQVLLINIAMQLSRIEKMVENLSIEMHHDRIAEVLAGVDQFEKAILFHDHINQRQAISNAVQTLHTGLRKTIAELRHRIAEAPDTNDSIMYHLTHLKSKTQKAAEIMGLAQESFRVTLVGIKTLAECYATLGEHKAASKVVLDYFDMVVGCDIKKAAEKARLVRFSGNIAPQEPWEAFLRIQPNMKESLALLPISGFNKQPETVEIEFMPSDLKGGQNVSLS